MNVSNAIELLFDSDLPYLKLYLRPIAVRQFADLAASRFYQTRTER